ncbi:HD domain-containing protein [Streptomyces sp. NPDC102381]|uniref:HD domain-containing protein n=1 Tax=Streptomyces sp. NPDC102381 TaxID=3366164 RepID=UPI003830550E
MSSHAFDAAGLARGLLREALPRRWAHSQGVAARAAQLAQVVGAEAKVLEQAAVLHDVGYAPELVVTGFHPLDGARFLRRRGDVGERVVRLVANHSFALLEAEERGLQAELEAEFPLLDEQLLVDALVFCDMTTTPYGEVTNAEARIEEIRGRYGDDSVVGRFIRRAAPRIQESVRRVRGAAAAAGVSL